MKNTLEIGNDITLVNSNDNYVDYELVKEIISKNDDLTSLYSRPFKTEIDFEIHPSISIDSKGENCDALEYDLEINGQVLPVILVINNGRPLVIDGIKRQQIMKKLELQCTYIIHPILEEHILDYRHTLNVARHQYTKAQLACLACELKPSIIEENKKKISQKMSLLKSKDVNFTEEKIDTNLMLSKKFGVSHTTITKAQKIRKEHEDIYLSLRNGNISLHEADALITIKLNKPDIYKLYKEGDISIDDIMKSKLNVVQRKISNSTPIVSSTEVSRKENGSSGDENDSSTSYDLRDFESCKPFGMREEEIDNEFRNTDASITNASNDRIISGNKYTPIISSERESMPHDIIEKDENEDTNDTKKSVIDELNLAETTDSKQKEFPLEPMEFEKYFKNVSNFERKTINTSIALELESSVEYDLIGDFETNYRKLSEIETNYLTFLSLIDTDKKVLVNHLLKYLKEDEIVKNRQKNYPASSLFYDLISRINIRFQSDLQLEEMERINNGISILKKKAENQKTGANFEEIIVEFRAFLNKDEQKVFDEIIDNIIQEKSIAFSNGKCFRSLLQDFVNKNSANIENIGDEITIEAINNIRNCYEQ